MRNTKLYSAIIKLNGFELNRLHRFLVSPYFNQSQPIIQFFELIKEDIKKPSERELPKEEIWRLVMGDMTEYNDARFRKLQSDLLALIEDFFAIETFRGLPINKIKFLMEAIHEKKLDGLKKSSIKQAVSLLEGEQMQNSTYHYYQYEIEKNIYLLTKDEAERSAKLNLENIVKNLDRFYLAEKLRYSSFILTHQHFVAVDYQMLFTDEIIQHIEQTDYNDTPSILIYYQILQTYKQPANTNHYEKLKEYINQFIKNFPETEAREILDAALNYGIIRMNAGETKYIREVFDLYWQLLQSNLLLVQNQIDPWSFKNIVTTGLRLGEFSKVETFINTYGEFLDPKFRANSITFNLAQLFFYKKEFKKVIQQISQVEYEDFTYNLNSKTLLMASYYELDENEALNSLLDAFRLYVQRNNKLTKGKGSHYLNTISIVRKMAKILPGELKAIAKLEKEIESTQGIVSKNWILEKLAILKGETPPSS